MHVRFWELGNREVINCKDGRRLGCVGDIEIDLEMDVLPVFSFPWEANTAAVWEKKGNTGFPMDVSSKLAWILSWLILMKRNVL